MSQSAPRQAKKKKRLYIIPAILIVIVALLLILAPHGKHNYLFIGMDNYGSLNDIGRSDTILLVHLDFDQHKIGLVTFARDILLDYNGSDKKINTIIRLGGEDALMDVISSNFDIELDGWFRLNFSSLVSIIDAIGGVSVEITDAEAKYITKEVGLYPDNPLTEGECRLNGAQSLSYVRCRKLDNDFGRGNRQSKLVNALIKESRSMGIRHIVNLFNSMKHAWRSNLNNAEQLHLVYSCLWLRNANVTRAGIPFDNLYHYGNSSSGDNGVLLFLDRNVERLHETISF
ncbi:MAG: LCP family protein [Clostridia bacterium]|nr:LCP family protein [Clostridia bacterium]